MFVLCFLSFYPVVLTVMPIVPAFNFQSVWVAQHAKEGLGPPTNMQICRGSFALRNRDRAERERKGGIL